MKKRIVSLTLIFLLGGCASSENKNTYRGAGIGAVAGGAVGAVVGKGKGAAVGAVIGGAMGGLVGRRMDRQAKELKAIAETKRTDHGLVTKLKSDILFDTGKSDLKPQAKSNLNEMAGIMKKYPENVLAINGYTDNTGSSEINNALSERRAQAVRQQLVASGLPESTITTYGRGSSMPIADNSSAAGRKQNRRVEIEVTVDQSKVPEEK